jgi:acetolactate synthase-1/2/3 large subunit
LLTFDDFPQVLRQCRQTALAALAEASVQTRPGVLHPHHAVRGVMEALAADTAIAFDGGEIGAWFLPFARAPGPGLMTGNGCLGTLGVGQGYGLGLARAQPDKPVALIMGDGAAGFHISEFDSFKRHGLPILTIIFNNSA